MKLANTVLPKTECPNGTVVEIEELGKGPPFIPCQNLLQAVIYAYATLRQKSMFVDEAVFVQRVEVIDYDQASKLLKVRVAD